MCRPRADEKRTDHVCGDIVPTRWQPFWLVVFVDGVKELPATLLLRPFNYDTLATRVHEKASLENLGDAAPAAILVMLVGLAAVGLMARANR